MILMKKMVLQHLYKVSRGRRLAVQTGYRRSLAGSVMTVLVLIGGLVWMPLANAQQTPEAEASLPPQVAALLEQLQAQINAPTLAPVAPVSNQAQGLVDSLLIQLGLRQPTLAPAAGGFNPLAFLIPQTGLNASAFNPLAFLQPTQNPQSVLSSLFAAPRMQPSTWGGGSAGGFGLPFAGAAGFPGSKFNLGSLLVSPLATLGAPIAQGALSVSIPIAANWMIASVNPTTINTFYRLMTQQGVGGMPVGAAMLPGAAPGFFGGQASPLSMPAGSGIPNPLTWLPTLLPGN
jgi:hypothetical protein